jgi:recombination protein U
MSENIGKKAEEKIQLWLDRPQEGYCFDRIYDQMTGFFGSTNICDFTLFKVPYFYYIESKCTEEDRFDFSMITDKQRSGLLTKSQIDHVFGWVIVLFATYHRAFVLNIQDIVWMEQSLNKHSLNINKVDKWPIPYKELQTVPSRKLLWDYIGQIEEYIPDKRSE